MKLPDDVISLAKLQIQQNKNSDTPTRHMYHKAFFEAIVVDEKKITALKWEVPFSLLYQPNYQSVLQPLGEPSGDRTHDQELKRLLLYR